MVFFLALILLPGTVVHELSHWLMAKILFIKTGKISLFPEVIDQSIKLGSVEIAKSDAIRRVLVGVAPVLFGLIIILGSLFLISSNLIIGWNTLPIWLWTILFYLIFITGNTMFSSKKDLEGSLAVFGFISGLIILFHFLGMRLPYEKLDLFLTNQAKQFMELLIKLMVIPLGFNLIFIFLINILLRLIKRANI